MAVKRSYWLVKSEPDCFSIHDLAHSPRQTTCWSGVRNYQARNFMRAMKKGDCVLFYHSSTDPPNVAGTAVVVREAYPDTTALDPKDDHYDPKATTDNPIWEMIDIRLQEIFAAPLAIADLRAAKELVGMELLRKGSRLSVQPVRPHEFSVVERMAKRGAKRSTATSKTAAKKPAAKRAASGRKKVAAKGRQKSAG